MACSALDDRGRRRGAFRYDTGYLDHPMAFSLDPAELPLLSRDFETNRHEHVLHFDYDYFFPGKSHLAEFGKRLGVPKAALIVNEIAGVVATWQDVFKAFAVPASDIENLSAGIAGRLRKV